MSLLHELPSLVKHQAKRLGRGYGSGKGGHTSSRGQKGQRSRNGGMPALWFEGGQLPLIKRLPMIRGKARFNSLKVVQEVQLTSVLKKGLTEVTVETLAQAGLIRKSKGMPRLVGATEVTAKLNVMGIEMSKKVQAAIEKAGGSVQQG